MDFSHMNKTPAKVQFARLLYAVLRIKSLALGEFATREYVSASNNNWFSVPFFGFRLPLEVSRSVTHKVLCIEGERFVEERHLLADLIEPGDTIVDVGANVGYLTLLFKQAVGTDGSIICIEPDSDNLRELRRCVQINSLSRVEILNAAVGDCETQVQLSPGLNGHINSTGTVCVPQVTLNSFIDKNPRFVKVDVEGYELKVIQGATELLKNCKPRLFVEMHPALVPDRSNLRTIFQQLRSVYTDISFHEYCSGGSVFRRILERFGILSETYRFPECEALLTEVEAGHRNQPFWLIAR
jgi:FkbM family methyltransferase